MTDLFVGAIADDDTGAADLAGMLAEQGMRAAVGLDTVTPQLCTRAAGCDAVVIGTASRSLQPKEAYSRTRVAARALQSLSPKRLAVKYCSTFDSTPEGNIGPSVDAAMDVTGERFTVALPALPALGRTTYMGYHFVGRQLLSDSSLRNHPLNSMKNANLLSHLSTQTSRRLGLVTFSEVQNGPASVRSALHRLQQERVEIALLDCVDQEQLRVLGEAICDMRLFTGSSAWGMVLPEIWREGHTWIPSENRGIFRAPGGSGFLLVNGSCSEASLRQNTWAADQGWQRFELDAISLAQGEIPATDIIVHAGNVLAAGEPCLLTTQGSSRQQVQEWSLQHGVSSISAGEEVSATLARTAARIIGRCVPQGLILAGGETSSVLMRALRLGGLLVGPPVAPGVPVCVSLAQPALGLVLKSGNFGAEDFFGRAITAIRSIALKPISEQKRDR